MDHYLEIKLLPDPEFSEEMLMAALFAKLHRALGRRDEGDIGVSFPLHDVKPGAVLRLHGTHSALLALEAEKWRAGLHDYCLCSAVQPVPVIKGWRSVSRVQVKSCPQRLLRRSVRKGWLNEEDAKQRLNDLKAQRCTFPYLQMKSLSNGESFRLFIRHSDLVAQPRAGKFSSYGLSSVATVPWF